MTTATGKNEEPDEYGGTEIIVIEINKDIFNYVVPLDGKMPLNKMKQIAASGIAQMIIDKIQPEFQEMPGYELMTYKLIIKKYE